MTFNAISTASSYYIPQNPRSPGEAALLAVRNGMDFTTAIQTFKLSVYDENIAELITQSRADLNHVIEDLQLLGFDFSSEEGINLLSKIINLKHFRNVISFIANVPDEKVRTILAKELLNKNILDVDQFVELKITNPDTCYLFAETFIEQSQGFSLAFDFEQFNIPEEPKRAELLRRMIPSGGLSPAVFIFFKISDPNTCAEFAEVFAKQDPKSLCQFIKDFNLSEEVRLRIFVECMNISFFPTLNRWYSFNIPSVKVLSLLPSFLSSQFSIPSENFNWVKKYLNNKNPHHREQFAEWFIDFTLKCDNFPKIFNRVILLQEIAKRHPQLREKLSDILFSIFEHEEKLKRLTYLLENYKQTYLQISLLIFSCLTESPQEICEHALNKIGRIFRIGENQKALAETLINILNCSLSEEAKTQLISAIFNLSNNKSSADDHRLKAFPLVNALIAFEEWSSLRNFSTYEELQRAVRKTYLTTLESDTPDFETKYQSTIGNWRKNNLLPVYLRKLIQFDDPTALSLFKKTINECLEGTFIENRYSIESNVHLATLEQTSPGLLERWKKSVELDLSEILLDASSDDNSMTKSIQEMLREALCNNHLDLEDNFKQNYPSLASYLFKDLSLKEALHQITIENSHNSNLEKTILEALEDSLKKDQLIEKLILLKTFLKADEQFYNDVQDFIDLFRKVSKEQSTKVTESDHPNDFFLMGTEVLASCQHIESDTSTNICLLGYARDGKHRLLLVVDSDGTIVGRSVLRLLRIQGLKEPALFLEKTYTARNYLQNKLYIRKLAIKKAAEMKLPLFINVSYNEKKFLPKNELVSLEALDKPVAYEYVDALNGIQAGPYTIPHCQQIFS